MQGMDGKKEREFFGKSHWGAGGQKQSKRTTSPPNRPKKEAGGNGDREKKERPFYWWGNLNMEGRKSAKAERIGGEQRKKIHTVPTRGEFRRIEGTKGTNPLTGNWSSEYYQQRGTSLL